MDLDSYFLEFFSITEQLSSTQINYSDEHTTTNESSDTNDTIDISQHVTDYLWTPDRVKLLIQLTRDCRNDWKRIAKKFKSSKITASVVKSKYRSIFKHSKLHGIKFTRKEDLILAKYFFTHGNDWSAIAKHLPGRSALMIKNRYYSTIRRKNLLGPLIREVNELESHYGTIIDRLNI